MKRKNLILIILTIISLAISIGLIVASLRVRTDVAPEGAAALIGGNFESGYSYSGYIINQTSTAANICGIVYLSQNVGVTAAHCLDNTVVLYPHTGQYNSNFTQNSFQVSNYIKKPGYVPTTSLSPNDIGVVIMQNGPTLGSYATLGSPTVNCNYYIVAYGIDENGQIGARKGLDACITEINGDILSVSGNNGSICGGDSGSGLYEKNTNKLIGITSSREVVNPANPSQCNASATGYFIRLDTNASFINQYIDTNNGGSSPTPTPTEIINSCPAGIDAQFWYGCPGEPYGGCNNIQGWLSGNQIEVNSNSLPLDIDVNCFSNSGSQLFENSRTELYLNGNLVTSSDTSNIRNYNATQAGTYEARCIHKTIANCSATDSFTVQVAVPTPTPTVSPTTINNSPIATPTITNTPTATPTGTLVPTNTPTITFTPTATLIPTNTPTHIPTPTLTRTTTPSGLVITPTTGITILPDTNITKKEDNFITYISFAIGLIIVSIFAGYRIFILRKQNMTES